MIAINFTTARGRLKDFCDRVTDRGETVSYTHLDVYKRQDQYS